MFNKNKVILLLSVLLILLVIIPISFAAENQTDIEASDADDEIISVSPDEEILTASNDYYFDASAEDDNGDGSLNNPFKYLTADRIKANANIYLANGNYELDQVKSIQKVNIYGSDPSKTIISYDGHAFDVFNSLTLTNLTLNELSIVNYGKLNATNTFFNYGYGNTPDSYGNNYGGAIACPYDENYAPAEVNIDNCTFNGTYAVYGGAIFMDEGILNIINSNFYNCIALNYGGAIACEYYVKLSISKSKFINCSSLQNAGGAIYLRSCSLNANNVDILNSKGTFGGAITSLDSDVSLSYVNIVNSSATYEGGAVYHMYGKFTSFYNKFVNNTARNGGALFIDNSTAFALRFTTFDNNYAEECGGAFYSILSTFAGGTSPRAMNTYTNNRANYKNDEYIVSEINIQIGNGNYTMYKIDPKEVGRLPSRYSLVTHDLVTIVKDQQSTGNCWAFTALATLESCILKATGEYLDLSENNMVNVISKFSDYGWDMDTNNGGYDTMPFGYLTSWLGPVYELQDLFDDRSTLSPVINSSIHIQNIVLLKRDNYLDNNAIKEAIMKYGAVATSMFYDSYYSRGNGYYCWASIPSNHAVTIVGWDDTYSSSNFFGSPSGDGAWIVRNSWGPNWNNEGYFYVSYYDMKFAEPGLPYSGYTFLLNDTIRFDKNYQYDIAGRTDYLYGDEDSVWYKNIFTSTGDEYLAAVSTYFDKEYSWAYQIIVNNELKSSGSGITNPGYYTINLEKMIKLNKGDVFEVIFNINGSDTAFPISEIASLNKLIYKPGISFVSYDGSSWTDLYNLTGQYATHNYYSQVACIKAFTYLNEINTLTSLVINSDDMNSAELIASVVDEFGNIVKTGNVTFSINGIEHTVNITDGFAKLSCEFDKASNSVSAIFSSVGYKSSQNQTSFGISKIDVDLTIDVNRFLNNANVTVTVSNSLNDTVTVLINNKKHTLNLTNGSGVIKLTGLENGEYNIEAELVSDMYCANAQDSFLIEAYNVSIKSEDLITFEQSGDNFIVTLVDDNSNPIINKLLEVKINGSKYAQYTNVDGKIFVPVVLDCGKYSAEITFNGDENYFKANSSNMITVKANLTATLNVNMILNNASVDIELSKPVNENITVLCGDDSYSIGLVDGKASLDLSDLANGEYNIKIVIDNELYNLAPASSKFVVDVKKTSIESDDDVIYRGQNYTFRLVDENGNAISNKTVSVKLNDNTKSFVSDDNGVVSVPVNENVGKYNIEITFNGDNNYFASNSSNTITVKDNLTAELNADKNSNNVTVTVKFSENISEDVIVSFGNESYNLKAVDGKVTLKLNDLPAGDYNIKVTLDNEFYNFTPLSGSVSVTKTIGKTKLLITPFSEYYKTGARLYVTLLDENNKPVALKNVCLIICGKEYTVKTDSEGKGSLPINLNVGSYKIEAKFKGDEGYSPSSDAATITVKSSITLPQATKYTLNSKYRATLFGAGGKLVKQNVDVVLNGVTYKLSTDSNGQISLNINLKAGKYTVKITNPVTGEVKTQTIQVVARLTGSNLVKYYLGSQTYKVRVFNDNGGVVGAGESVAIKVSGKTYTAKTDKNGYASLKINLPPKTYKITATYKGFTISNSIVVKPTLVTSNIAVKKGATIKYTAKVLDTNGKILKNKKVTFKLAGKTYTANTNKNGNAVVSIKNSLKVGKYTIVSTYGTIKNNNIITVKK